MITGLWGGLDIMIDPYTKAASGGVVIRAFQYVSKFDLLTNKISGFGSVPTVQGAAVIGNRMEIITSPSGIDYLYFIKNSGTEMYRAPIWF
jgi:hypothetical protein